MSDLQRSGLRSTVHDPGSLREWLRMQPPEVSGVIAVRAALRASPLIVAAFPPARNDARTSASSTFAVFWATALARAAAKYQARAHDFRSFAAIAAAEAAAAEAAATGAAAAANAAAAAAATAATVTAATFAAPGLATAASAAAGTAVADIDDVASVAHFWGALSADVRAIGTGRTANQLAGDPLWLQGAPKWADDSWKKFQAALSIPQWTPWLEWYQRRLDGRELSEEIELLFVTLPVDPRETDPLEQNALLAAEIARLTKKETHISSENVSSAPPELPQPGPAPKMVVQDEQLDLALHRPADEPPLGKRSAALLNELREAARDFESTFDARSNAHAQVRKVLRRYQDQIDLDNPDVDLIFALGLRLENAARAADRSIADGFEPTLEDSQQESLASVLQIHAVFIASDPDGVELLEAAERYAFKPTDDERFKTSAEPVAARIGEAPNLAKERVVDLLREALAEMGQGEHPARTGLVGRNTTQSVLVKLAQAAILGVVGSVAGQIVIHTGAGQLIISDGAVFSDKAIAFFLNNSHDLRALAAVAPEGFGFLGRVIDWLKMKLGV
jgi:hypothetical protein